MKFYYRHPRAALGGQWPLAPIVQDSLTGKKRKKDLKTTESNNKISYFF